ncbi:MAG: hypothetical protein RR051_04215 [Clostridiales bacterium]
MGLFDGITNATKKLGNGIVNTVNNAIKNSSNNTSGSNTSGSKNTSGNSNTSGSSGMSQGKDGSYYGTGGSGKQFGYNPATGGIAVMQNGQTQYIGVNDANYANTKKAMEGDVGFRSANLGGSTGNMGNSNPSTYEGAQNIANSAAGSAVGGAGLSQTLGSGVLNTLGNLLFPENKGTNTANTVPTPTPQSGPTWNRQVEAGSGEVSGYNKSTVYYDRPTDSYYRIENGTRFNVSPGSDKWNALRQEYNDQQNAQSYADMYNIGKGNLETLQKPYIPTSQEKYTDQIMSMDEAMDIARQMMSPQFQKKYQQTAMQMSQNLERAGMYDSLYGQALMQNAQNAVTTELESAVAQLAGELQGASREQALALLQMAMNDNQFGAGYKQDNLNTSLNYIQNSVKMFQDQLNTDRDYDLKMAAQALEEKIVAGQISQTEAEIAYQKLQSEMLRREMAMQGGATGDSGGRSVTGGNSGKKSVGSTGGDSDSGDDVNPFPDGSGTTPTQKTMLGTSLSEGGQRVLNSVLSAKETMGKETALMSGVSAGLVKDAAEAAQIAKIAGIRLINLPTSK